MNRLLAILFLTIGAGVYADDAAAAADNDARNDQTIIVAKNAKPGDIPVDTTEKRQIIRFVNQALADAPDGAKARVILKSQFSNHPDHYGVNAYPHAVVALDEQGLPHGIETFYSIGAGGGGIQRTTPWVHGKQEGEEKLYAEGYLKDVIPWHDGKVEGIRKTLYPDGKVQVETTYKDGEPNGPQNVYDPDGKRIRRALLKNGKRDGEVKDFWPDTGKEKRVVTFDHGKVVGVTKDYYQNGQLKRELPFKDDVLHGIEKNYDADGKLTTTRYWLQGEPVSEAEFKQAQ